MERLIQISLTLFQHFLRSAMDDELENTENNGETGKRDGTEGGEKKCVSLKTVALLSCSEQMIGYEGFEYQTRNH